MNKKRRGIVFRRIDLFIIGVVVAMVVLGALLLALFPQGGRFYLFLLDVRFWPPWKCAVWAALLAQTVVIVRHWPDKRRRIGAEPHE